MNKDSNTLHIFIGPRKTGTSWLHYVASSESKDVKEIYYPTLIGRKYVFNRYIKNKSLLIWPYLVHEPKSLRALVVDLKKRDIEYKLYWTDRDERDLMVSMKKFANKYGEVDFDVKNEYREALLTLKSFEDVENVTRVKIIDANDSDIKILSKATNVEQEKLKKYQSHKVYETNEVSRFKTSTAVKYYFKLKPFLPRSFLDITRNQLVRDIFFKKMDS